MKLIILLLAIALCGASSPSYAATPKPSTKPKVVVTKKHTVHHYIYRKRVRKPISPSPSPVWPPPSFTSANGVYARVPTGQELIGILSSKVDPVGPVDVCAPDPKHPNKVAMSCGAVLVASTTGCSWWEVNSTITGIDPNNSPTRITFGTLRVLTKGTAAHQISTVVLVSGIPLTTGVKFTGISAKCWLTPSDETIPSSTFTISPGVVLTPTPTPSPVPTATLDTP